jgi:serine phosphatase RsbU (regulator of sigma subunit)
MRLSIGIRVVLILLMATALLTLLPANENTADNSAKDQAALNRSTASQAPPAVNSFGLNSLVHTRWDVYEKKRIAVSHELETARQIQSFILPGETVNIKGLRLAARYVPMASLAGDFYDFIKDDDLTLIVADYQHV